MNLNWNLDKLYSSFDNEEFTSALLKCEQFAEFYNAWIIELLGSNKTEREIIESYIKKSTEQKELFAPVSSFAGLSYATDSTNNKALVTLQKLRKLNTLTVAADVLFENWLNAVKDIDSVIDSSDLLREHSFFIEQIIIKSKYSLNENTEEVVAKMRTTGSRAWATLQQKTTSNITADVELEEKIETLSLQSIRNLAFESDPVKRKLGYEAEMEAYKKHAETSASALNGIKGEALTICELRGYSSPLEQTLVKSKMNKETLDAMLSAIKDVMPKFRSYFKRKAELLGHKNGLPFYDIFAPMGEGEITYTVEEGKEFILKQFKSYSDELYKFALNAFDNNWIDYEPKKGKGGGAFCASLLSLKESRILLNYTGKFNDVVTLAHELGHGFHNYNLFNQSTLNIGSPMPLAETASIFCATIVKNAVLDNADETTAFSMLEASLQGDSQLIIDIYSRFVFEASLFEARKDGSLSVDKIKSLMVDAQKQAYGDGLDENVLHSYMWMNKVHYYIADMDFYNFPYAFGLLFSKGIYARYKNTGDDFTSKLNELLSSTGKMNISDCAKILDVDVNSKQFWTDSLNEIGEGIDKFIELSN